MWWGKRYTRGCPDMRKQGTHPCAHACVLAANAILPSALTPPPLLSLPPPPFLTPPPSSFPHSSPLPQPAVVFDAMVAKTAEEWPHYKFAPSPAHHTHQQPGHPAVPPSPTSVPFSNFNPLVPAPLRFSAAAAAVHFVVSCTAAAAAVAPTASRYHASSPAYTLPRQLLHSHHLTPPPPFPRFCGCDAQPFRHNVCVWREKEQGWLTLLCAVCCVLCDV